MKESVSLQEGYLRQVALFLVLSTSAFPFLLSGAATAEPAYFRCDAGLARSAGSLPGSCEAPEALRWRVPLDPGRSTPILHEGKVFLTTYRTGSKELATV